MAMKRNGTGNLTRNQHKNRSDAPNSMSSMKTQRSDSMKMGGVKSSRQSTKQGEVTLGDLFFSGATAGNLDSLGRHSTRPALSSTWRETEEGPVIYIMDPPEFLEEENSGAPGTKAHRRGRTNMKKSLVSEYWKSYAAFPETWPWVEEARALQFTFNDQVSACMLGSDMGQNRKKDWKLNGVPQCDEYTLAFGIKPFVVMSPNKIGVRKTLSQEEADKTGDVLVPGQCVLVDSCVVHHDVSYLRLADTSNWVFEAKGDLLAMAPMEEMESGLWWYRVICKDFVEVRRVPSLGNLFRSGCIMCPGEVVVASLRCFVDGVRYLKLADGRGWIFEARPEDPDDDESDHFIEVMCECEDDEEGDEEDAAYESEHLEQQVPTGRRNPVVETGLWQYQVLGKPLMALGNIQAGVNILQREYIIIDKRVPANGATAKELEEKTVHNRIWLRIADGRGWIPKTDLNGEQTVKFIGLSQDEKPPMRDLTRIQEMTARAGPDSWKIGVV